MSHPKKLPRHASRIVLCFTCGGEGYRVRHETTCYHKGEYDVHFDRCGPCAGTGRLREVTRTTYEPIETPENLKD